MLKKPSHILARRKIQKDKLVDKKIGFSLFHMPLNQEFFIPFIENYLTDDFFGIRIYRVKSLKFNQGLLKSSLELEGSGYEDKIENITREIQTLLEDNFPVTVKVFCQIKDSVN